MPYIPEETRSDAMLEPISAGELNYYITSVVDRFLELRTVNYENINTVIGVLECAKQELYRRVAAPYEDKKIKENGDVYTCIKRV